MEQATTQQAYSLFHQGTLALADVEANGMRVDVDRLDRTANKVTARITKLEGKLKNDEVYQTWRKRFGGKTQLGSRQQLGQVLYGEMGFKSDNKTKTGRVQVNESALEKVDHPFVKRYLEVEKLKKLKGTYLNGVKREVVDGLLHPSFNLHLVKTHRSSSDSPNFQNIPIRDKLIGKLIRSCFVAREGHQLVEVDYSALEFKIAACWWKDDAMVAYASDPTLDIHRDMAAECYCLPVDEVPKDVRFFAKNQFVFPELYGSYYVTCARNLWSVIESGGLKTKEGTPLDEHLLEQGIEQKDFEEHIEGVEEAFNDRFPTWSDRKEKWWNRYQRKGSFPLMTGFIISGVYSRNNLMNYPIQGPAFHCLLWSLIQMNRWLKQKRMRTKIVGQIHDSIVADVHEDELDDYLLLAKQVMTESIRKAWDWIITPLAIEAEVSPPGGTWFDKREVLL